MSGPIEAPPGFGVARTGRCTLLAAASRLEPLCAAGLGAPDGWERHLGAGHSAGRGAVARTTLATGERLLLKRMRRGGWAGRLWRDRFLGRGRLLRNLEVARVALGRAIPTPAPVALLLCESPRGLYRAWLATEEVEGARDARSRVVLGPPLDEIEVRALVALVRRMHDAGIDHTDLNLGNLLVVPREPEAPRVFVVDLDGARVREGPLPFGRRQRALRRLERSCAKAGAGDRLREAIYRLYPAGDASLDRALRRGRFLGRVEIALHRWTWSRR